MIQATNTEHLEPLEATKPSVTTGWSRATAYGGADYITDGHSLVVTSAIPAAASQRLLAKLTVSWPTRLTRPNQEAIATFVTRVVSNATLTATLLGVAGGQAFLQVGERAAPPQFRQQVLIPAARLAYLVKSDWGRQSENRRPRGPDRVVPGWDFHRPDRAGCPLTRLPTWPAGARAHRLARHLHTRRTQTACLPFNSTAHTTRRPTTRLVCPQPWRICQCFRTAAR